MKKLTIKIIPSTLDRSLSFSLPVWCFYLLFAGLAILFITASILITKQSKITYNEKKFQKLKKENEYLRKRLKVLHKKFLVFQKKVDTLEKYIIAFKEVANLDAPPPQIELFGIGGRVEIKKELEVEDTVENLLLNIDRYLQFVKTQKKYIKKAHNKLAQDETLRRFIPSLMPTSGLFTSGYGWRRDPFTGQRRFHKGIDLAAPVGTPVIAPADGIVEEIKWHHGYGLTLVIRHKLGFSTVYAHLSRVIVKVGQQVKRGQIIAYVGKTGRTTGPHLHYEIRIFDKPVNPLIYIIPPGEYFD